MPGQHDMTYEKGEAVNTPSPTLLRFPVTYCEGTGVKLQEFVHTASAPCDLCLLLHLSPWLFLFLAVLNFLFKSVHTSST